MLKGTKSISLSYQSIIHNEESGDRIAVYMSAQIPESGRSNSSKTIQDLDLYEANKAECRKDMVDFDNLLFDLEDQQTQEAGGSEDTDDNQKKEETE